ncbi:TraR/DksA family transcriptional regulator [Amycolatopsis sp.]|jgi:RNA polymerase-binding transcription factor DksA|uniref:TraR/DksA family transcriptional regulator n=1 Tax=Amycolatopsis sp. TaxID=37632 RepID=UPI002DF78797|nr:TraR/DksA C4-type zinc finger protein [Amycolatopsis sp.]
MRQRLDEERAATLLLIDSLTRQIAGIIESSTWTTNDDEHDPEGATIAFERAQLQSMLEQARGDLGNLDRAERRLEQGTYGLCERCGKPIPEARLDALPAVTFCIECVDRR